MSSNSNILDWETINPMSNEGTRLAVVENEIRTMKENQADIYKKLESIQRFQWVAVGGLIVVEFLLRHS